MRSDKKGAKNQPRGPAQVDERMSSKMVKQVRLNVMVWRVCTRVRSENDGGGACLWDVEMCSACKLQTVDRAARVSKWTNWTGVYRCNSSLSRLRLGVPHMA